MTTLDEAAGKFYMGKNKIWTPKNEIADATQKLKEEKEAEELKKLLLEAEKSKQEEINNKLQNLELMPIGNQIVILPYPKNPYRKVMEGNIIVDYDGDFFNPDSGNTEKSEEIIKCAKVIEVGPECKYVMNGDDIYYDKRATRPLPFMSLGYFQVNEPNVMDVINEGLKERFKNYGK